jgi:hypothetical protein
MLQSLKDRDQVRVALDQTDRSGGIIEVCESQPPHPLLSPSAEDLTSCRGYVDVVADRLDLEHRDEPNVAHTSVSALSHITAEPSKMLSSRIQHHDDSPTVQQSSGAFVIDSTAHLLPPAKEEGLISPSLTTTFSPINNNTTFSPSLSSSSSSLSASSSLLSPTAEEYDAGAVFQFDDDDLKRIISPPVTLIDKQHRDIVGGSGWTTSHEADSGFMINELDTSYARRNSGSSRSSNSKSSVGHRFSSSISGGSRDDGFDRVLNPTSSYGGGQRGSPDGWSNHSWV